MTYYSLATSSVLLNSYFSIAPAQQKQNPELILKPTFASALFKWLSATKWQNNNNDHNYTEFVLLQITHQSPSFSYSYMVLSLVSSNTIPNLHHSLQPPTQSHTSSLQAIGPTFSGLVIYLPDHLTQVLLITLALPKTKKQKEQKLIYVHIHLYLLSSSLR